MLRTEIIKSCKWGECGCCRTGQELDFTKSIQLSVLGGKNEIISRKRKGTCRQED